MAKIVATRKDNDGNLSEFKLDDGRELNFADCYAAIDRGEIPGVIATSGKEGVAVIRSMPDGDPSNNLSNLDSF